MHVNCVISGNHITSSRDILQGFTLLIISSQELRDKQVDIQLQSIWIEADEIKTFKKNDDTFLSEKDRRRSIETCFAPNRKVSSFSLKYTN